MSRIAIALKVIADSNRSLFAASDISMN